MARTRDSAEEIVNKLREGEVLIAGGATVAEASRKLGISDQTYYKWRREYGGLKTDQAKRFKELERENARLKKLVADLSLDKAMLQDVASGNF
jgi:transposase-like protein